MNLSIFFLKCKFFYSFVILVDVSKTKKCTQTKLDENKQKNADSCFREFFFLHVSYMSTMIYLGKKTKLDSILISQFDNFLQSI